MEMRTSNELWQSGWRLDRDLLRDVEAEEKPPTYDGDDPLNRGTIRGC